MMQTNIDIIEPREDVRNVISILLNNIDITSPIKLVNIRYSPDIKYNPYLPGIDYVYRLRSSGDNSKIIFYGIESINYIRNKKGGNILESDGIFYLEIPCPVNTIVQKILDAEKVNNIEKNLSDEFINSNYIEFLNKLRHSIGNVMERMKDLQVLNQRAKEYWDSMRKILNSEKSLISKLIDQIKIYQPVFSSIMTEERLHKIFICLFEMNKIFIFILQLISKEYSAENREIILENGNEIRVNLKNIQNMLVSDNDV